MLNNLLKFFSSAYLLKSISEFTSTTTSNVTVTKTIFHFDLYNQGDIWWTWNPTYVFHSYRYEFASNDITIFSGDKTSQSDQIYPTWINTIISSNSSFEPNPYGEDQYFLFTGLRSSPTTLKRDVGISKISLALLFGGLILFALTPFITKSVQGRITIGVLMGWMAALIILIFMLHRFSPKISGLVISALFIFPTYVYSYAKVDLLGLVQHPYFIGYMLVAGFVGFVLAYRWTPAEKDTNILLWSLRSLSLALIYNSSHVRGWGVIFVFLTVFCGKLGAVTFSLAKLLCIFCFCCTSCCICCHGRRQLTSREFEEEGRLNTEKELASLREQLKQMPLGEAMIKFKNLQDVVKNLNRPNGLGDDEDIVPVDHNMDNSSVPDEAIGDHWRNEGNSLHLRRMRQRDGKSSQTRLEYQRDV